MNAQLYAMPTNIFHDYMPVAAVAWPEAPRRAAVQERATAARPAEATAAARVWEEAIREVLEAAGALAMEDIAGALGVLVREARPVVLGMVDRGGLRVDEWERLRLAA